MPSLMLKPMAKSVRSDGVVIMTTWERPLKARATGTSAAIAASRGTTAEPWRRKQVMTSERRRTLRICVDDGSRITTSLGAAGRVERGHGADDDRDGFCRGRLTLGVVMGERQQRIGLWIVGRNGSGLDVVGQRGEAAHHPLHAIVAQGFDVDEPVGSDAPRRHVVLVHEDDGPGPVDAAL